MRKLALFFLFAVFLACETIPPPGDESPGGSRSQYPESTEVYGAQYPELPDTTTYLYAPVFVKAGQVFYPRLAQQAGMEGTVLIKMLVDENGSIKKAEILKSSGSTAGFDEAAIAAAEQCKFTPAMVSEGPVACWVLCRVEFRLKDVLNKSRIIYIRKES